PPKVEAASSNLAGVTSSGFWPPESMDGRDRMHTARDTDGIGARGRPAEVAVGMLGLRGPAAAQIRGGRERP
ncbi:MAG: hypothetical protein LC797_15165, partial [Chloroflexi bacterium]|nr:hypothetical protein [Chloroflexota bacterium]